MKKVKVEGFGVITLKALKNHFSIFIDAYGHDQLIYLKLDLQELTDLSNAIEEIKKGVNNG